MVSLVLPMIMRILIVLLLLHTPVVMLEVRVSRWGPHTRSDSGNDVTTTRGKERRGRGVHRGSLSHLMTANSDPNPTQPVAVTVGSVVVNIDEMAIGSVLAPQWPETRVAPAARVAPLPGHGALASGATNAKQWGAIVRGEEGDHPDLRGAPSCLSAPWVDWHRASHARIWTFSPADDKRSQPKGAAGSPADLWLALPRDHPRRVSPTAGNCGSRSCKVAPGCDPVAPGDAGFAGKPQTCSAGHVLGAGKVISDLVRLRKERHENMRQRITRFGRGPRNPCPTAVGSTLCRSGEALARNSRRGGSPRSRASRAGEVIDDGEASTIGEKGRLGMACYRRRTDGPASGLQARASSDND